MYLLVATAASWLILLGSFCVTCINLPTPRTTPDLAVLVLVGAATLAFSRIGFVSLLTLLLRLLPDGRLRSTLSSTVIRTVPTALRSSVLAAVSATVAVQAAQAASAGPARVEPTPPPDHVAMSPRVPAAATHSPTPSTINDPSWPTVPGRSAESDASAPDGTRRDHRDQPGMSTPNETAASNETAAPQETESQNPGWPTTPDSTDVETPSSEPPPADAGEPHASSVDDAESSSAPSGPTSVRIVREGESLWTIAADLSESPGRIRELVADIYADNREVIGPDPNLIMPGQRLEFIS